jgi:hypothetical protein
MRLNSGCLIDQRLGFYKYRVKQSTRLAPFATMFELLINKDVKTSTRRLKKQYH